MLGRERLKRLAALKEKKYRRRYGRFLVEGPHLIQELAMSDWPVEWLLLTPDRAKDPALRQARRKLEGRGASVALLSEADMARLSEVATSQGVVAVCPLPDRSWSQKQLASWRRVLLLDGLGDPGNVGAIIRTAAWFGWDAVLLGPGSADPYNPKAVRASMGGLFFVPVYEVSLEEALEALLTHDVALWAAVAEGGRPLGEGVPVPERVALLIGSEAAGIRPQWLKRAHARVCIPRLGRGVESLNAAVAAGILLAYLSGLGPKTSAG
ncbi:MAG: RNA methyltransferase [Bacteroidetes bacterium]|nr:RNA methyltransferase [Rhodothermia bacterium]MCS7154235.1 RNA methyltransferase [Bacteroidota bacterium]MCX7906729.1 RNA methyltransferase [Bacteroidota bacterium]MDW8136991.1 RNA methyltransferase [Bacteroidota bacterium]MDW8285138.1 RNA methyltransferase [Bacteroidota bacterium]